MRDERTRAPARREVKVWDLPTRVFHWSLVLLVMVSWATAQIGGNAMQIHVWSGLSILTLVLFRVAWGFLGSTHARFANFLRGPRAALAYTRALRRMERTHFVGHNPLGAWMVIALLANLLLQAVSGLFSNDDVMLEGPLAARVSKQMSDLLTRVHHLSFDALIVLVGLHVAAALFYLLVKRENLIRPMITGRKTIADDTAGEGYTGGASWLALLLLALCAAAVWLPLA